MLPRETIDSNPANMTLPLSSASEASDNSEAETLEPVKPHSSSAAILFALRSRNPVTSEPGLTVDAELPNEEDMRDLVATTYDLDCFFEDLEEAIFAAEPESVEDELAEIDTNDFTLIQTTPRFGT